ncbi:Uncharacterized protein OBRU01_20296, partial [Operophtera brumata]
MDESNNFELIFKKNSANRPLALYNTTNVVNNSSIKPRDVLNSVYSQIRTIQLADGSSSKVVGKLLNGVKRSSFLPVNKLPVDNEVPHQTNRFETQCVSDTQLINIIEHAEALVTHKGMTQEFNTTFAHTNIGDRNSDVTLSHEKIDRENNEQLKIEELETIYTQSNVDETVLLHDTMEKDEYNETDHTQLDNIMELNRDVFELTSVGTLREMCDKVIKQNKSSEISVLHSDKCIENHCREVSRKLKDRDSQNIDPIHTETENEGKKKDNVIEANHTINLNNSMEFNNIDEERSPSPVLKMKTKCKITKMATPLVVSLESFEKFERLVLPHIDINEDDDICKHMINSQILGGELCLNTNEEVLFNRRGNLSPIIERISDIVAEKLIVINRSTDEILFSSDEETDYINKELKDLPLTAALETSFNDHSNVSEETMYVGFQTASNKSIQIYTESLQKAQHIFDKDENIDGTDFSLTELVDICDKKNLKHLSSPDLKVKDKIYSKVKAEESKSVMNKDSDITQSKLNDSTEHHKMIEVLKIKVPAVTGYDDTIKKPPEKQNFVGFKTASNKRIDLSDKALELGKKVFVDFDISEKFDSVDQHYLEPISEEAYVEAKVIVETYLSKNDPENDIDDKITDDMIIQEFENIEMSLEEKEQLDQMNRKCTEKILLPNESSQSNCKPEVTTFIGFKTANNKNIKISAQALAKTKIIFHDIDSENDKPVDDLEQKYDIQAADYLNQSSRSETAFAGFKTANVKDIQISEVALSKSSKTFMDIDSESPKKSEKYVENRNKHFEGFKTASNKRVDVSEQALLKSRKIFQEMEDGTKNCNDISSFSGFKTANNKAVTFTEESIARSKKLFEDFGKIMYQNAHDLPCENDPKDHNPTFKGFQTANKKPITVSVLALERSKKIFQDIDDSVSKTNTISESPFKGFQTASNKDVVVTKEALDASKKLLDKFKIDDSTCSFVGFKTASNKKIDISEEALAKCKKIFDDMDDLPTENLIIKATSTKSFGFQTANNKKVKISKKALEKTKTLFNDIEFQEQGNFKGFQTEESTKPFGFQTANNKQVQITKEALQNTKTLFNDIEFQEQGAFKGFQTASKKKVEVSKEAIEKSKAIFNDIELSDFKEQEFISVSHTTKKPDEVDENIDLEKHGGKLSGKSIFCFQMANFNTNLSKDAMKYSKNLLEDTSYNENKTSIDDICDRNTFIDRQIDSGNLESIINTQVLNNFEETLCTEDFKDSQRNSKRAGSPILFCPRAKRRKRFETPYKADNDKKSPDCIKNIATKNTTTPMIKFGENYKKNKICTLKDLTKFDSHGGKYIDPYIFNFNLDNILNFEFVSQRNEVTDNKISVEDIKNIFLKAVNRNLVPEGWLDNHLKLILWKLISYEIKFPDLSFLCTVQNVIDQLKYRYDKELYNAERPALRKIFEKDDVPTKTMLFGNSTRPARWHAKLGYTRAAILSHLSSVKVDGGKISRLRVFAARVYPLLYVEKFEDGSTVTRSERLELLHQIKYEAERELMMERIYEEVQKEFSDQLLQDHTCKYRERALQAIQDRIQERVARRNVVTVARVRVAGVQDGGRLEITKGTLYRERALHAIQGRIQETVRVAGVLDGGRLDITKGTLYRERALQAIQDRIQERVARRNVVTVSRVRVAGVQDGGRLRVAGVQDGGRLEITKGMLSIWKPNDAILELFKEGSWVEIMNVVPTAIRYSEIQISAGRQSVFRPTSSENELLPHLQSLTRTCFKISDVAQNPSMTTDYNEIDTVGIVFLIEPSNREFESNKNFQNVYLADADKNIICVNFWGGLKKFGYENILDTGQVVACANLQKRAGNNRKNIPQFRVTEFTFFTKTPKNVQARKMVDDLNKKLFSLDRRKLCDDCIEIKNNYAAIRCLNNYENESPYRFNKSDYSFARNKMFIDTPLGVKTHKNEDINLNLTGLDFESTFKQITQELSPKELLRKKKVNEKIAKLKMYGEPPRLSPITITNKSENAKKSYKSPLASVKSSVATSNLPTHSVSTINKLPEESPKTTLRNPLNSLNRTC